MVASISREASASRPRSAASTRPPYGADARARRLGDRVGLGDQQRRRAEVAAQRDRLAEHVDAHGEDFERPDVAGELGPRASAIARQLS